MSAIVDGLVPELRRRGVVSSDYQGTKLREHLGLPRPEDRSRQRRQD
jgi:hypothetical protein